MSAMCSGYSFPSKLRDVEFTTIVETVVVPKVSSAKIVVDHMAALDACYLEVH